MKIVFFDKKINKIPLIMFVVSFFYFVSLFIAPLTLEPGTVKNLDGNANMVDYTDKWDDLPLYHQLIYLFSDFNCHQKDYRSYYINENQMPVCARDVGIFFGFSLGFVIMMFIKSEKNYKDVLINIVPRDLSLNERQKTLVIVIFGLILILPMALDGGIQLITSYESTNPVRTITGLLFGVAFSLFISSLLISAVKEIKEIN